MEHARLHAGLATARRVTAPRLIHSIVQQLFTALAGEEVSFREAAILIFAAHWLTGVGEPQLRCHLERPSAVAPGRREALQHPVHNPLRLRLAYAMRLCDFREECGSVHWTSSGMPSPREVLIFIGGNY